MINYHLHPRKFSLASFPPRFVTETRKERIVFQPSIFRGELLNFGGVIFDDILPSEQKLTAGFHLKMDSVGITIVSFWDGLFSRC